VASVVDPKFFFSPFLFTCEMFPNPLLFLLFHFLIETFRTLRTFLPKAPRDDSVYCFLVPPLSSPPSTGFGGKFFFSCALLFLLLSRLDMTCTHFPPILRACAPFYTFPQLRLLVPFSFAFLAGGMFASFQVPFIAFVFPFFFPKRFEE